MTERVTVSKEREIYIVRKNGKYFRVSRGNIAEIVFDGDIGEAEIGTREFQLYSLEKLEIMFEFFGEKN